MTEKRKFPRVRLASKGMLSKDETNYQGKLENISLNGALVRFDQCVIVPPGGGYNLTVYIDGEDAPLQLVVEVIFATYSLVGVKFVSWEGDAETRLRLLVERITSELDGQRLEQENLRKNLTDYLR